MLLDGGGETMLTKEWECRPVASLCLGVTRPCGPGRRGGGSHACSYTQLGQAELRRWVLMVVDTSNTTPFCSLGAPGSAGVRGCPSGLRDQAGREAAGPFTLADTQLSDLSTSISLWMYSQWTGGQTEGCQLAVEVPVAG